MRLAMARSLAFCFLVATPVSAFAAGFYVPDVGARALGRAGAFVARADDLTAAWYNPAGLADQGGTRFSGDVAFVKQSVFFQAENAIGVPTGFPSGNSSFPFTIPFLGISSDFGLKNFTFAFALYGPYAGQYSYAAQGEQRYSLIDSSVWEAIYQFSAAWRITPWLRVGLSVQNEDVRARQKLAVAALPVDDNSSDVKVEFDVADNFSPNFHLGVLASPLKWLDLGVAVKLPMSVNATGKLKVDKPDLERLRGSLPGVDVRGENVGVDFELPLVVRAGARFKMPRFDVEADFVWERWTGFSKLVVQPKDIQFRLNADLAYAALSPIVQDRGYGNAYSIRVGGDFEIIPGRLTGRAGYYFETSAIPTASLNPSAVDADKHGFSVGLTAQFGWFALSLAYGYTHLNDARVTDSVSRQINLTYNAVAVTPDPSPVVGNGRYRSGYDILSLGISIDIDTIVGWKRRQ